MALIPPDAGIRMRMQTEAGLLQPAERVGGIPSDLPELQPGQVFQARIQEVMPESTYKALVAGKQITLQLPEGAKAGDTLELVVVDRTPKVVIARLTEQSQVPAANEPYPHTSLSRAGRMIGSLVLPEGESPRPAILNRGEPLLSQPPARAADLVPALQKAIAQSGLFYESHQAQWVAGKIPLEQILHEPQGQRSLPATLSQHGLPTLPAHQDLARASVAMEPATNPSLLQILFGGEERLEAAPSPQAGATPINQAVPEELRPLVQQQLDAVVTQRLIWHGEVWPGQNMEWEIVREDENGAPTPLEDDATWRTTLRLETPRLGHVDASLRLTSSGLHLALTTSQGDSAADLRVEAPALAAALNAAGITLLSFEVKNEPE